MSENLPCLLLYAIICPLSSGMETRQHHVSDSSTGSYSEERTPPGPEEVDGLADFLEGSPHGDNVTVTKSEEEDILRTPARDKAMVSLG